MQWGSELPVSDSGRKGREKNKEKGSKSYQKKMRKG